MTISRLRKDQYLGNSGENEGNIFKDYIDRQPEVCLHDFIPGTVQKIAFEQGKKMKVALLYRVLDDQGYFYRVRIIDLRKVNCKDQLLEADTAANEEIEDRFEEAIDSSYKFHDSEADWDYLLKNTKGEWTDSYFEDFVLPTRSLITAINLYTS